MWVKRATLRWLTAASALALLDGCDVSKGYEGGAGPVDPVVVDYPIAFIERPVPLDENGEPVPLDVLDPTAFNPGAKLVIKQRADASAPEWVVTDTAFGEAGDALYDVKDLHVSSDGKKLLFSMRAPAIPGAGENEQPTWNIWQYDTETLELDRLTAGNFHDVSPRYMADGRIVFSSTRQRRTRVTLLDEGKPQYSPLDDQMQDRSFSLHVMDTQGVISQISFNPSHDLSPTVLANGEIAYLRWDAFGGHDQLSLYKVNPDGTNSELYYGFHSQLTGTNGTPAVFANPQSLPDGRLLVNLRGESSLQFGGDLVAVDARNFTDLNQPTYSSAGAQGPGQASVVGGSVDTSEMAPSLGGYFNSAYPLYNEPSRLLVSWSQCRLANTEGAILPCVEPHLSQPDLELAPPLFGIWVYDTAAGTQLPVKAPSEGLMYTEAVALSPYPKPEYLPPYEPDEGLAEQKLGVLHIRSVYDVDGVDTAPGGIGALANPVRTPTDQRPVRFMRLYKHVPLPSEQVLDFDRNAIGRVRYMREILGYVPVEPDGSVMTTVPSDVAFGFDFLDAGGKRVRARHDIWLNLRPGEVRECGGCHNAASVQPHGRESAETPSSNTGSFGGIPFTHSRLLDENGNVHADPQSGETMAEYYARVNDVRTPTMDLQFSDEWTNPASGAQVGTPIDLRYQTLQTALNRNPADPSCAPLEPAPSSWMPPTACSTTDSWNATCRSTIHYLAHIQPIWEADRRDCDAAQNIVTDYTCTSCHSRAGQAPAGQLELTGDTSQDQPVFVTSYVELMFDDNAQEVVDGNVTDVVEDDGTGVPTNVVVPGAMVAGSAQASTRFFDLFAPGGSHAGYLSAEELKLIAEWLDIGGQYYNDPFAIPAD